MINRDSREASLPKRIEARVDEADLRPDPPEQALLRSHPHPLPAPTLHLLLQWPPAPLHFSPSPSTSPPKASASEIWERIPLPSPPPTIPCLVFSFVGVLPYLLLRRRSSPSFTPARTKWGPPRDLRPCPSPLPTSGIADSADELIRTARRLDFSAPYCGL